MSTMLRRKGRGEALLQQLPTMRFTRRLLLSIAALFTVSLFIVMSNSMQKELQPERINDQKEGLKVMLFITTHMSMDHVWFLKSCWPPALQNSHLLNASDVVVYMTPPSPTPPPKDNVTDDKDDATTNHIHNMKIIQQTFQHQNLTIHTRPNKGYHEGAKAALTDAIREGWWKGYDWVIRVNPDVIIRNDTFLLNVMNHDTNATAILINCVWQNKKRYPIVHTDFFALKPDALPSDIFLNSNGVQNAERSFTKDIGPAILQKGNHRWWDDARPKRTLCRAGSERPLEEVPIIHYAKAAGEDLPSDFTCLVPFS